MAVEQTLQDILQTNYKWGTTTVEIQNAELDARFMSTMASLTQEADEQDILEDLGIYADSISDTLTTLVPDAVVAGCSTGPLALGVLGFLAVIGAGVGVYEYCHSRAKPLKGSDANADICPASSSLTFHDVQKCEPFMYIKKNRKDALFQDTKSEFLVVQPMCGGDFDHPVNCGIMWTCDGAQKFTKLPEANSWKSHALHVTKQDDGTLEAIDAITNAPVKFENPPMCKGIVKMQTAAAYTMNPPTQCVDMEDGKVTIAPNSLNVLKLTSKNNFLNYSCGNDSKQYLFSPDEGAKSQSFDPSTYISVTRGLSGNMISHKWNVPFREGYPCQTSTDCCSTLDNQPGICAEFAGAGLSCYPWSPGNHDKCRDFSFDCDGRSSGSCCRTGNAESPIGLCREGPGNPGDISCFPMNQNGDICHNSFASLKNSGACTNEQQSLHCAPNLYSCYAGSVPALGQCNASDSYFQDMKSCSLYCQVKAPSSPS